MKYISCLILSITGCFIFGCTKKAEYAVKFNPNEAVAIDTSAHMEISAGSYNILYPVNGINRKFIVQLPAGFNAGQSYPVVFAFHGTSDFYTDMKDEVGNMMDGNGYVGVYPAAATTGFNIGLTATDTLNDTAFVNTIINWLRQKTNVRTDAGRFYAMGIDGGGAFAHYLGLHTATFAAIAPVSASLAVGMIDDAVAGLRTPVMQIHGDADEAIPFGGGAGLLGLNWESAQNSIRIWAAHNTCGNEPVLDTIQTDIIRYSYPVFVGAAESDLVVVKGASTIYDTDNKDIINDLIWQFFARNHK